MAEDGASITAQQNVLQPILKALRDNRRGAQLITGPSGTGKTWIASRIRETLEKDDNWKVFYLPCPEWSSHQPYSAFEFGLSQTAANGIAASGVKFAATAARDIPFVGNTTSAALTGLLEMKREKRFDLHSRLPKGAQDICFKLQKTVGDRRSLIIIDDAHWVDASSHALLRSLLDPELSSYFSFLLNTNLVVVATAGQGGMDPADMAHSLGITRFMTHSVAPCSEPEFYDALRTFGLRAALQDNFKEALYRILVGHLKVAKHLVDMLNADVRLGSLDDLSSKKALQIAVDHKLSSMGLLGADLRRLLSKAIAIGGSFTVNELSCLVGVDTVAVQQKLDEAERVLLVTRSGRQVSFAHSVVREFFEENASPAATRSDHEKFAECLRLMRPGFYGLRAAHLAQAGFDDEAVVLSICDALEGLRSGLSSPWATAYALARDRAPALLPLIDLLSAAHKSFSEGDYSRTSEICSGIVATAPAMIATEAAILLGRALTKDSSVDAKSRAAEVLRDALENVGEEEAEMWGRATLYLAVAEAYAGNLSEARAVGKRLYRVLEKRLTFDSTSKKLLNRFRLRADMFFSDDVAAAELKRAIYDLIPDDGIPPDPTQAYVALCNSSGNALYRGHFIDALDMSTRADTILSSFGSLAFPRMDILGNNQLLATWLSGKITTKKFAKEAKRLVGAAPTTNDTGMLYNNFAAGLALTGRTEEASQILAAQFRRFDRPDNSDHYDRYFLGNNLAGCLFDLKRIDQAFAVWVTLRDAIEKLPYSIRDFFVLRHAVIDHVFSEPLALTETWDNYPRVALENRIGTMWRFFGRGFLVSELQFWSDD